MVRVQGNPARSAEPPRPSVEKTHKERFRSEPIGCIAICSLRPLSDGRFMDTVAESQGSAGDDPKSPLACKPIRSRRLALVPWSGRENCQRTKFEIRCGHHRQWLGARVLEVMLFVASLRCEPEIEVTARCKKARPSRNGSDKIQQRAVHLVRRLLLDPVPSPFDLDHPFEIGNALAKPGFGRRSEEADGIPAACDEQSGRRDF